MNRALWFAKVALATGISLSLDTWLHIPMQAYIAVCVLVYMLVDLSMKDLE